MSHISITKRNEAAPSIGGVTRIPAGVVLFIEGPSTTLEGNPPGEYNTSNTLYRTLRQAASVEAIASAYPDFTGVAERRISDYLYYLPIKQDLPLGKLFQVNRLCRNIYASWDGSGGNDEMEVEFYLPELVDNIFRILDGINLGIDTATIKAMLLAQLSDHCSVHKRWGTHGEAHDYIERDYATVRQVISYLSDWTGRCLVNRTTQRRVYRNSSKLAASWGMETLMAMGNHIHHGQVFVLNRQCFGFIERNVRLIGEYFDLRGSRLDQADQQHSLINPIDSVIVAFRNFSERVKLASDAINEDNQCAEGGEAVEFNGYKINVKMAYLIATRITQRILQSRREGNPHNNFQGHIWKSGSTTNSVLPVICGNGATKHILTIDMLEKCIDLIVKHPPIAGEDGLVTVDIGNEHADISNNITINAELAVCAECGAVSPHGGLMQTGSIYRTKRVDMMGSSEHERSVCSLCAGRVLIYAADIDAYVPSGRTDILFFQIYNSTGRRTGNRRDCRVTAGTVRIMEQVMSACANCGNRTLERRTPNLTSAYNDMAREFITHVIATDLINSATPIGSQIQFASGRDSSSTLNFGINRGVTIHDSGSPFRACSLCYDITALYTDPTTGLFYSNVDASPSAPAYGYTVEDTTGRFLPRVIGIEFETGPGSSNVNDKDGFLNRRCSDGLHVWHIHSDGSLMSGACEITTPPIGGLAIPMGIDAIFELAKGRFQLENRQAGMHIHCNITDLFTVMLPIREKWYQAKRRGDNSHEKSPHKLYRDFCNLMGSFGDALSQLSRKFVSATRRHNTYCSGGFGIRSWSCPSEEPMHSYASELSRSGRSAVCIHQHNGYANRKCVTYTMENRIWPSSNSKEYTLARAELTQKSVDMFCELGKASLTTGDLTALRTFVGNYARLWELPVHELVGSVCAMLNISPEGRAGLEKLHKRYFWVSYYAHEHGLSMSSPEILTLISDSNRSMGIASSTVTAEVGAEIAGIMAQKGFTSPLNASVRDTLSHTPNLTVMDTILSSNAAHPLATESSDLVAASITDSPVVTTH